MNATAAIVEGVKKLILEGDLLPGQQLRQEQLAERFGVSRLPVREALRQLAAEGLVSHTPNVGYVVARLNQYQFDQLYLIRQLLETAILERLPAATAELIFELRALNARIGEAGERSDLAAMRNLNQDFHFAIFRWSQLDLLVEEVSRMWTWAMPYHTIYLTAEASRLKIVAEHNEMIDALERGDLPQLIACMDEHRQGPRKQLKSMLQWGPRILLDAAPAE